MVKPYYCAIHSINSAAVNNLRCIGLISGLQADFAVGFKKYPLKCAFMRLAESYKAVVAVLDIGGRGKDRDVAL